MSGVAEAAAADRDALLDQAKTLRVQGRPARALEVLDRLENLHPRFSRLHQERGRCHVLRGDARAAVQSLMQAVRLNPALPASWDMLEQLHRMTGDAAAAQLAAERLDLLRRWPAPVVAANSLFADGDLAPAETVLRAYLGEHEGDVAARHLLARIRRSAGDLDAAQTLLEAVLVQDPDYRQARSDYVGVLLQQGRPRLARGEAERLLRLAPNDRDARKHYGAACIALGDYEPVIDLYQGLLSEGVGSATEAAELRLWRANALKATGRTQEAIADYRAALAARPDYGVAWFSLANLKTYRFDAAETARMQAAHARPDLQDMDRIYLSYALGKAFEDRCDYETSWRFYAEGDALRRRLSRYRPEVAEDCVRRLSRVFTAEAFAWRQGWGVSASDPIFILGLPRSGSTLIEQILASHPQVEGTQELTQIDAYVAELCGRDADCGLPASPQALLALRPDQIRALGERFLSETRVYRRLGRPFFIDKMPNNFWHVGLIQLILPQARIIDVRRAPMACGFSNLKQLFGAANQEFTYGVECMGRHYRAYLDLMRHWDRVLPGRVLRVVYEDVVEDLEGQVRRLLDHCGLPFDPACLAFHQTSRSVRTPSSEQVRRPLSREGLSQWRNYGPWLEPLRTALGDAVDGYRD